MRSCILFLMAAKSVQGLQNDPNSFEYEAGVARIMNQMDELFKLLEKTSQKDIQPFNDLTSRRVFIKCYKL